MDNPRRVLAALEIDVISVTLEHARLAGTLVHSHKDPFDRMLAAQALIYNLTLVRVDEVIDGFAVARLW